MIFYSKFRHIDYSLDCHFSSKKIAEEDYYYSLNLRIGYLNKPYLYYLQIYNKGSSQVKLLFTGTNQTIDTNGLVSGNNIILKTYFFNLNKTYNLQVI